MNIRLICMRCEPKKKKKLLRTFIKIQEVNIYINQNNDIERMQMNRIEYLNISVDVSLKKKKKKKLKRSRLMFVYNGFCILFVAFSSFSLVFGEMFLQII